MSRPETFGMILVHCVLYVQSGHFPFVAFCKLA